MAVTIITTSVQCTGRHLRSLLHPFNVEGVEAGDNLELLEDGLPALLESGEYAILET